MRIGSVMLKELVETQNLVVPCKTSSIKGCSIDLHASDNFGKYFNENIIIDLNEPELANAKIKNNFRKINYLNSILINKGDLLLLTTEETVHIPKGYVGILEGRSSLARLGLFIHVSSGRIDSGFNDKIVLELVNTSNYSISIPFGYTVAALSLEEVKGYDYNDYLSSYSGSNDNLIPVFK